jgi:hypothetical protein
MTEVHRGVEYFSDHRATHTCLINRALDFFNLIVLPLKFPYALFVSLISFYF